MADPMRQSGFFPPMVTQMVSVGESTGEMDTMLVKVADYYEEEVDVVVANLLTITRTGPDGFPGSRRGRHRYRHVPAAVQTDPGTVRRLGFIHPFQVPRRHCERGI